MIIKLLSLQALGWCFQGCRRMYNCRDVNSPYKECEGLRCVVDGLTIGFEPYCTDWLNPNITNLPNVTTGPSTTGPNQGENCPASWQIGNIMVRGLGEIPAFTMGPTPGIVNASDFTFSLLGFVEMNSDNSEVIHFEPLQSNTFQKRCETIRTPRDTIIQIANYTATLSNGAPFHLTFSFFENDDTFEFGSANFTTTKGAWKFGFDVAAWPFRNPNNTFQMILRLDCSHPVANYSGDKSPEESLSNEVAGNLTTTTNTTLRFRFLRLATVDGRTIRLKKSYAIINPVAVLSSVVNSASFVIKMATFNNTLTYDPDFSILFGGSNGGNGEEQPDNTNTSTGTEQDGVVNLGSDINGFPVAGAAGITVACVVVIAGIIGFVVLVKKHPPRSWKKRGWFGLGASSVSSQSRQME